MEKNFYQWYYLLTCGNRWDDICSTMYIKKLFSGNNSISKTIFKYVKNIVEMKKLIFHLFITIVKHVMVKLIKKKI